MTPWRAFFAFAALYNFAVGGAMLFGAEAITAQTQLPGSDAIFLVRFAGLLIATFGVAYALVAHDPPRNRNLVVVGGIGKVAVALLAMFTNLTVGLPPSTFALALGDLFFAVLFALFLVQSRKA